MNDTTSPEPAFSGIDLAKSFLPDWAKAPDAPADHSRIAEKFGNREEERPRRGDGRRPGGPQRRNDRPDPRQRDSRQRGGPRDRNDRRRERPEDSRRHDSREQGPPVPPPLSGWNATLIPDPRGIDGLAKQIKSGGKAYPLFDLAVLILEKPERYRLEFRSDSAQAPALFRLELDGSLWTSEKEAIQHILSRHLDKFYRRERITVDPPKGSFSCIAVSGDIILGPPNHHDYQRRLREVHAARFRNVPFEAFKSRVQMVREPEFIEKWKESQSSKDEFYPAGSPDEGTEPVKFADMAAVEAHFRATHAGSLLTPATSPVEISGAAALGASATGVRQLANRAVADLRRFPLPLAHIIGQGFAAAGLQIFKAHENITYVSVARPRYLDRTASPVAEGLATILDYLESHPTVPRPEQWKALLAGRTAPADEAARESALASDLSWLIHQGHVVDYAKRGLEAVRKPKPPREGDTRKKAPQARQPQAHTAEAPADPEPMPQDPQ